MSKAKSPDGDVPTLMVRITLTSDGARVAVDWDPTSDHLTRIKAAAHLATAALDDFFGGDVANLALTAMLIRSSTDKVTHETERPTCGHPDCEAAWAAEQAEVRPTTGLDTAALDAARKKAGFG